MQVKSDCGNIFLRVLPQHDMQRIHAHCAHLKLKAHKMLFFKL